MFAKNNFGFGCIPNLQLNIQLKNKTRVQISYKRSSQVFVQRGKLICSEPNQPGRDTEVYFTLLISSGLCQKKEWKWKRVYDCVLTFRTWTTKLSLTDTLFYTSEICWITLGATPDSQYSTREVLTTRALSVRALDTWQPLACPGGCMSGFTFHLALPTPRQLFKGAWRDPWMEWMSATLEQHTWITTSQKMWAIQKAGQVCRATNDQWWYSNKAKIGRIKSWRMLVRSGLRDFRLL